jgi:hypothetical protein
MLSVLPKNDIISFTLVGSITVRSQYSNNSFEKILGSSILALCASSKLSK